jgi:hypothetical protein
MRLNFKVQGVSFIPSLALLIGSLRGLSRIAGTAGLATYRRPTVQKPERKSLSCKTRFGQPQFSLW